MELEASAWLSRALHLGVRVLGVLTQVHVEAPLATDGAGVVQGMAVRLARTRLGGPVGGLVQRCSVRGG